MIEFSPLLIGFSVFGMIVVYFAGFLATRAFFSNRRGYTAASLGPFEISRHYHGGTVGTIMIYCMGLLWPIVWPTLIVTALFLKGFSVIARITS